MCVPSFGWEFSNKNGVDGNLPKLVEEDKSHKEVSILLRQTYPELMDFLKEASEDFAPNITFMFEIETCRQQTLTLLSRLLLD